MATGQKYENGMLEGFLVARNVYAFRKAQETENPEAMRHYLDACIAFGDALILYDKEGDSPEVMRLTELGMDKTDEGHAAEKAS